MPSGQLPRVLVVVYCVRDALDGGFDWERGDDDRCNGRGDSVTQPPPAVEQALETSDEPVSCSYLEPVQPAVRTHAGRIAPSRRGLHQPALHACGTRGPDRPPAPLPDDVRLTQVDFAFALVDAAPSPTPGCCFQRYVREGAVGWVDCRPGRDDLVYAVEDVVGQYDLRRCELCLQLLERPGSDQRRHDRRVGLHEAECKLQHGQSRLFGEAREFLDRVELALVVGVRQVEPLWQPARPRRRLLPGVFAPPAGQPAIGEWAVGQHADVVPGTVGSTSFSIPRTRIE